MTELSRRDFIKLAALGSLVPFVPEFLLEKNPTYQAYVSSNEDGGSKIMLLEDHLTGKAYLSFGKIESTTTSSGNPATLFIETTGIQQNGSVLEVQNTLYAPHSAGKQEAVIMDKPVTLWADMLSLNDTKAQEEKLIQLYEKYEETGIYDETSGLTAFSAQANLTINRGVITNEPSGATLSLFMFLNKKGEVGQFLKSWRLTPLKPVSDPEIGFGQGYQDVEIGRPGNEILIPAATPESKSLLSSEVVEKAQEFFGNGFEITSEGKVIDKNIGTEIQGFTIVPFDKETMTNSNKAGNPEPTWALQRVYQFQDQEDFTIYMTQSDIKILEKSGLDMHAWIYENGELRRQTKKFDARNNSKIDIEVYTTLEAEYMITINSSQNPARRVDSFRNIRNMTDDILKIKSERGSDKQWKLYITCLGMYQEVAEGNYWATNIVPMTTDDGTIDLIETTEYIVKPFKDRSLAAVGWYDTNDNPKVIIVESNVGLDMPRIFNPYWEKNPIENTSDK